ncbi:MAG TPA: hypothetical protein DCW29_13330 [Janthinobacterium sp.]|nr:hypothetical protein [Janthinobacterium sp.]
MGLFSLFKKNGPSTEDETQRARAKDDARPSSKREARRLEEQERQRELAHATTLKIDAIEAAMAFDIFNTPEPAWGSTPKALPRPPGHTLAELDDSNTTELLGDAAETDPAATQTAAIVEEVAVLYAHGESALAEQMLVAGLAEAGDDRTVWWMLFDLYQVNGKQEQFDNLSIDYASKFETSPPAWTGAPPPAGPGSAYAGVTPTLALAGMLDASIAPALERLEQQADSKPVLRLEFNRVTGVDPAGCSLLLGSLTRLQARQRELIVVAAAELAAHIRALIRVGERGDSEPCWLLLLELLQLLNHEKEFEETGMDYCVTFEVSPPSFIPASKVVSTANKYASATSDRFMLPALMEGNCMPLIEAIAAYAAQDGALVFDCSRLNRLDFSAANALLSPLQTLAQGGKSIEFRDLNHLVAALLRLLAFSDIAKIFPHKY